MRSRCELQVLESRHSLVSSSQLSTSGRPFLLMHYKRGNLAVSGEAAPLLGFGQDNLRAAIEQLGAVEPSRVEAGAQLFIQGLVDLEYSERSQRLVHIFPDASPSARFCFEMLCARLAARETEQDLFGVLGLRQPEGRIIKTSHVIDPLAPEALNRMKSLFHAGVRTFKLKCGRNIESELTFLERAAPTFAHVLADRPSDLRPASTWGLRLDYNRSLPLTSAHSVFERLRSIEFSLSNQSSSAIEWVEDPTENPEDWHELSQYGLPLAVDESLAQSDPALAFQKAGSAQTVVIKPMAVGGFSGAWLLADWARQHGKLVCVSHLFDGPLAFEATAALAFDIQSPQLAAGLSAHVGLESRGLNSAEGVEFSWLFPDRLIVPNRP